MIIMETLLIILGVYFSLPLLLGGLARLFGALVDAAAWLLAGSPRRKPRTRDATAPSGPIRFPTIRLARVGGR